MPTYEYRCQDCNNLSEVVQSFSDPPLTVCEVCGGPLRRVFHPVGIVLKGSGFYATDNRSGKRQASKAAERASDSSGSGASSSGGKNNAGEKSTTPEKKSGSDKTASDKSSGGERSGSGSGQKPPPKTSSSDT